MYICEHCGTARADELESCPRCTASPAVAARVIVPPSRPIPSRANTILSYLAVGSIIVGGSLATWIQWRPAPPPPPPAAVYNIPREALITEIKIPQPDEVPLQPITSTAGHLPSSLPAPTTAEAAGQIPPEPGSPALQAMSERTRRSLYRTLVDLRLDTHDRVQRDLAPKLMALKPGAQIVTDMQVLLMPDLLPDAPGQPVLVPKGDTLTYKQRARFEHVWSLQFETSFGEVGWVAVPAMFRQGHPDATPESLQKRYIARQAVLEHEARRALAKQYKLELGDLDLVLQEGYEGQWPSTLKKN